MIEKNSNYSLMFKKEIFNIISELLIESGFSRQKTYIMLKRKFYRSYILTKNTKSVMLKLKFSRHRFKILNNTTLLNGFYYAKW
jgi:hypothetical protein